MRFNTYAQSSPGFYIPSQGKIFFNGDSATIFSNVINAGKLGVGKTATVNFKGRTWQNETLSQLPDESNAGDGTSGTGGMIRFLSTDTTHQFINGGYNAATKSGPGFPNLQIQNRNGVTLTNSTTKVRNELKLTEGLVYLDNNIMVVGNNNPGKISGYDSTRYLVTGNAPGTGLLVRENMSNTNNVIVFPVGSRPNAYTPAAIWNKSNTGDDFYVGVFDSVKTFALSGGNLQNESVNKTWEIGKRFRPNLDETELTLQHLNAEEGVDFTANKKLTFVSKYIGNRWDTAVPIIYPQLGYLTTGPAQVTAGTNTRTIKNGMPATGYYTKFTYTGNRDVNKTKVYLSGYRLDRQNVKVYWTTKPEINNNYFVVQRRFGTDTNFVSIDTVVSQAINGESFDFLNYTMNDPNNFTGNTFYRLILVDYNGRESFSNTIVVGPMPGGNQLLLWPNPSSGRFFAGISTAAAIKSIVVWDVLGQKLIEERVNDRSIVPMFIAIPGTYIVGFISHSGQIVESKKLLILGRK